MLVTLLTIGFQLLLAGTAISVATAMAMEAYAAREPRVGTSRAPAFAVRPQQREAKALRPSRSAYRRVA
jgi:hypothetical protein